MLGGIIMTDFVDAIDPPAVDFPSTGALSPAETRRAVTAASVGNALEFYDFVTFAFFAIQIGRTFFPGGSVFLSLMGALATFGAGFITRPIGAYVLGGYADRVGRKPAMLFSMTLMGLAIAVLALTPSYATIGIAAPIIAIGARLAQGFALGGEVGSATAYMMEAASEERRGQMISWQGASQNIASSMGALVGIGLAALMAPAQIDTIGWRIALLLGVVIVPFGLIIRRSLPETIHHVDPKDSEPGAYRSYLKVIILGFIIIGQGTITGYIFKYMATYGQNNLHLTTLWSMTAQFGSEFAGLVFVLIGGVLCDRIGRRPVMIWPQLAFALAIIPCFLWLTRAGTGMSFLLSNILLSALSSAQYAGAYAAILESIPRRLRARVFALVYSVPVAVFGGTTQLVITELLHVTGSSMSIAWYLFAISLIGCGAMLAMPETAPIKRRASAAPDLVPAVA
jgi:MHS family citrate/tricarballylate:H+ symporter-like MFS transporter